MAAAMWHLITGLSVLASLQGAPAPEETPKLAWPVTVTLDAQRGHAQFSGDGKRVVLEGRVRVVVRAPGRPVEEATFAAGRVEADLGTGLVVATGAKLLAGPALFAGDQIRYEARDDTLVISGAEGCVGLTPAASGPPGAWAAGFFRGQSITKQGNLVIILRGRITTCDRDHPHYSINARRLKYNLDTTRLIVYNAGVELYGLRVPLIPWAETRLGPRKGEGGFNLITTPGYSRREGVFLPYSLRFGDEDDAWQTATAFHLSQRLGVTGSLWTERALGNWEIGARLSRREWAGDDITGRVSLDRLPEVTLRGHFGGHQEAESPCSFALSFGLFREALGSWPPGQPPRPRVSAQRVLGSLSYVANRQQWADKAGNWFGLGARWSAYSTDEDYRDLEVFAGLGGRLTGDLTGTATFRHHFLGGTTPFEFDDVDIKTEVEAGLDWRMSQDWGLAGWARYDLAERDLRDLQVKLTRRVHCLTWGLYYRQVGTQFGLSVDLTGLTGGTTPYCSESTLQKEAAQEGLSIRPPEPRGHEP